MLPRVLFFLRWGLTLWKRLGIILNEIDFENQNQLERGERVSEVKCKYCGRVLCKGRILVIEIKCPRCGLVQLAQAKGANKALSVESPAT